MVLDLGLPDMAGLDLIESIKREPDAQRPAGHRLHRRDLTPGEQARLDGWPSRSSSRTPARWSACSTRRPCSSTGSRRTWARPSRRRCSRSGSPARGSPGKKVLIVDDDVRNIFALTSMLERWEMDVLRAENGRQALDILARTPGHRRRADGHHDAGDGRLRDDAGDPRACRSSATLPIIALTAKAMKDDRRKCLDAGASDYIAKPVQGEQLRSLLRVWLDRPW